MDDLISRQAAIDIASGYCHPANIAKELAKLPSAQPERTEYIPDTKAVRSKRDCVDLAERVTATFYDQEHEEWTQRTVTIADVLDSVCDEYTILPSAQQELVRCKECMNHGKEICYFWSHFYGTINTPDDGFCHKAERRTDDGE